jgi:hypothetical protein
VMRIARVVDTGHLQDVVITVRICLYNWKDKKSLNKFVIGL